MNTAFMVSTFCGQLVGTSAGAHVYAKGGWIASGSASVGFVVCAILTMVARGPWEEGWLGWTGGWSMKKKDKGSADGRTREVGLGGGEKRDGDPEEGLGAEEKVLGELAADGRNESPLDVKEEGEEDDKEGADRSSSGKSTHSGREDGISPVRL